MDVCWQRWLLLQKAFPVFWAQGPHSALDSQCTVLPPGTPGSTSAPLPSQWFTLKFYFSAIVNLSMYAQCTAYSAHTCWISGWKGIVGVKRSSFLRTQNWNVRVNPSYRTWKCAKMIYYDFLKKNQTMTWKAAYIFNRRGLINNGTSIWWNPIEPSKANS